MTTTHDLPDGPPASPVPEGRLLAGRWTVGARYERRGDVHFHHGMGLPAPRNTMYGEPVAIAVAAWRYRGFEPLPRFLIQLGRDLDGWTNVHHPNIAPTYDIGREVGETTCYWVIQAPFDVTLAQQLMLPDAIDPKSAVTITLAIGEALATLHGAGLVHGDVRPGTLPYDPNTGALRLAWGGLLPRLARAGVDLGVRDGDEGDTWGTAPELVSGGFATPATDVFGLAAVLFRLLHDRGPFAAFRPGASVGTTHAEPLSGLDPGLPDDLADLLERGLRRDPELRPSLHSFTDRLSDVAPALGADGAEWAASPPPLTDRTPPTAHRTLEPSTRRFQSDPALANTPTSAVRRMAPATPASLSRSAAFVSVPPVHTTLLPTPAPASRVPQALVALVLVLALGVSLLGLFVLLRQPRQPSAPTPAPAVVAAPVAPAAAPVVAVVAPSMLRLRTEPPGAEVFEGGTSLGTTPLDLSLGSDAAAPVRHLELRAVGYATYTIEQPWTPTDVQHVVQLQRERPKPRTLPGLDLREER